MKALWGLILKEIYHIRRDRRTLIVIVLMPIVQVILFGYAIRTDVENVRLAVVDPTPDAATLALRHRLESGGTFRTVAVLRTTDRLDGLFASGAAQQAVVLPPRFADKIARGLPATVLIVTDASDPNSGTSMQGYATALIQGFAAEQGAAPARVRITADTRMRFNPTQESANLFVPGLVAFVLTVISAMMTAISLTREKETGTMEALLVSPLHPVHIVIGKVVPYVGIGFVTMAAVLVEARFVFGVPIRGNPLLLLAEGVLFIIVSLSIGTMISTRTSSQRVAMMGSMVGTMLPTMLLSGFIFPIESMPLPLRVVSQVIPARWFVTIVRSIMLKGVGLEHVWRETLVLLAMAAGLLVVSARAVKIRLE